MAKLPFCFTALLLVFASCKTSKPTNAPKPVEQYNPQPMTAQVSNLSIPVNISVDELQKSLNSKITGVLYEDYSFDDNNNDGLMLKAMKSQDISLFMTGQALKYRIPLSIWMKKELLVGSVEAIGEIALNFKTSYFLTNDWSLATQTEIEYHEWIKKPVMRTGLGDLGIEGIANIVLNRSKQEMAKTIDKTIASQLNLRPIVTDLWKAIQEPTLLSPEYKMWVKTTPSSISMTNLSTYNNSIRAKIAIECLNDVTFGEKPTFRENSKLPDLRIIEDAPDDFKLYFATDVPFAEAERIAQNMMVGQIFGEGKQKVRVEDIKLWGNNDKVVVNTLLSGAFNGKIYFIGKPVFNEKKNQIEVVDLDFHVDTKSFLHKSASWLMRGILKNQLQKAMAFPLDENIKEMKKSIQESLNNYQIQPGITLNGTLDEVKVQGTSVTSTGILVNLFSAGKVNVDVKGL